ncbi:MAG TPA: hypothetical protein VG713_08950 [Pirellulales bacterium]|nr:hypothetical protein [Pirellulales bacterium]
MRNILSLSDVYYLLTAAQRISAINHEQDINGALCMLSISLIVASVGVIVLGLKGFTRNGIAITKSKKLVGSQGRVVGAICVIVGAIVCVDLIFASIGRSSFSGSLFSDPIQVANERLAKAAAESEVAALPWREYTSKQDGFSVLLPGEPAVERGALDPPHEDAEATYYLVQLGPPFRVDLAKSFGVAISRRKRAPPDPDAEWAGVRQKAVSDLQGRILWDRPAAVDHLPGHDLAISGGKMLAGRISRQYVAFDGATRIQLIAIVPSGAESSPAIETFLQSFKRSSD